jgi:3-hydroxyisobutyrate dehydrogenase
VTSVGFIGLGNMGGPMCGHVVDAGFDVSAFDLSAESLARAVERGARPAASVRECAASAEILITSLPGPPQVQAVLGEAIPALPDGALVVEMSTSSLEVGRVALAAAQERGLAMIDAPVAGQTIGAQGGTLAIYVGGATEDFERALPVLRAMGDPARILHVGGNGAGYAVKLVLNLTWFMQAVATAETLTMGVRAGVELGTLHHALVNSPATSNFLERDVLPLLDSGDYDEGFSMRLVTKDLALATELARDVGVPVEMTALVEQIHRRARVMFGDGAGELSAVRLYEQLAGLELRRSD